ncbi:MAG: T9SS type A sorting domain-containing protein [Bacteroidetes bacterium]|nr:T9SS type A sorting domain-containing protein [Bacteroidota bacterium]MBU1719244.1 T9SS type A sorting domain-containing protein [Bacteroidota bacterium]
MMRFQIIDSRVIAPLQSLSRTFFVGRVGVFASENTKRPGVHDSRKNARLTTALLALCLLVSLSTTAQLHEQFTINQPNELLSVVDVTHAGCDGSATGSAIVTPSGGTSPYNFLWSNAETTDEISNLAAGTYYISITDANNCSNENSGEIKASAGTLAPTVVQKGSDLLICTDSGYTYQWYFNSVQIDGETKQFYMTSPADHPNGYYEVEVWTSDICSNLSTPFNFSNKNLKPIAGQHQKLLIFPNPADQSVTIEGDGYSGETVTLICRNALGQDVLNKEITLSNGKLQTGIDISTWNKGVYFLEVQQINQPPEKEIFVKY